MLRSAGGVQCLTVKSGVYTGDVMSCEDVMAKGKWVAYLRVSTDRHGRSGLGLEAQRKAVDDFLNGGSWRLVKEFVEVESGRKSDWPVSAEAIKACKIHGAKLAIAKIDRLSRDAHFLLGLEKAGVDFVAGDMPNANRLTADRGIMAMIAEEERRMISASTRAALAAAKRRGVKLGGYHRGAKLTAEARKAGQRAKMGSRPQGKEFRRATQYTLPPR